MLNVVVLIGRLTADPELKYTPSGKAVATFRIAVNRMRSSQGEEQTDFINIVTWEKSAEFVANYLGKGRLVGIEGRLQMRNWVGQDGSKRVAAEVVANQVRSLERPRDQAAVPAGAPADEAVPPAEVAEPPAEDFDPFADE